jgi:capsular polysaccharide biosynthesis protein
MNPFFFPTEADEVFPRAANARAAVVGQTAFCGFNRHWANAGHWISDCVPAISSYDFLSSAYREDGSNPVILVPPLNPRMLRSLQLIGIGPESVKEVDPNQVIALDRLVVSSLLCGRTAPSPFCSTVYEQMVKRINVQIPASERAGGRGIYVSRLDGASRQMRNEQHVIEKLSSRGIVPIILSSMSMDERIEKFRNADFVVGAHGAGMANISFCQPGAVIYEIFPAHYLQSYHATLAQQVGLHYWADAYSVHEAFPVGCHAPWSIDTHYFEARLDEITNFHKLSFN